MVDLHSHILHGIDDGPTTCEQSETLIELEINDGVDTVALTPHFFLDHVNPEQFLEKREKLTVELKTSISARGLEIDLLKAAEVRLCPKLIELTNINSLCYEGTGYLLVELPMEYFYDWIQKTLYELKLRGITPIIAHIERYPYFVANPQLLTDLVERGIMTQINADSLVDWKKHKKRFVCKMISRNLVHLVATDTHSADSRPPMLKQAMLMIEKTFGSDTVNYFNSNSAIIARKAKKALIEH